MATAEGIRNLDMSAVFLGAGRDVQQPCAGSCTGWTPSPLGAGGAAFPGKVKENAQDAAVVRMDMLS